MEGITNISEKTIQVLFLLPTTRRYSLTKGKCVRDDDNFITQQQIIHLFKKSYKKDLPKSTISTILHKNKNYFIAATNNDFEVVYGLSERGWEVYNIHWNEYVLPKEREHLAEQRKEVSEKYFEKGFRTLRGTEIIEFAQYFDIALSGIKECPFEIKVKLKDKFLNDKRAFYELFMDKKLVDKIL